MLNQRVWLSRYASLIVLSPAQVLSLAFVCSPGCSPSLPTATVVGCVTYNGMPVTSGDVVMIGGDGRPALPERVRADGTFTIGRVLPGRVKVGFFNPPPPALPQISSAAAAEDKELKQMRELVKLYVPTPKKYADPEQSGLLFDLKAGHNECNIELK